MPFRVFARRAVCVVFVVFSLIAAGCAGNEVAVSGDVSVGSADNNADATDGAGATSAGSADNNADATDGAGGTSAGSADNNADATAPTVVEAAVPDTTDNDDASVESADDNADATDGAGATSAGSADNNTALTTEDCAAEIPLEIRIGQLMFPLVTQRELPAAASLAERGLIGGVVLIGNPTLDISSDISALQQRSLLGPVIVAVDEEGGTVQRLADITSTIPSAQSVAETQTLDEARETARAHAAAIGELGFTMNLAPVVDLNNGGFIRSRSFGSDTELVTNYGFATADGILDAGLTPVVKHFPGHGRGTDSHTGLPTLPELDVLRADDLIPFVRAAERGDLPIMIGHLVVPGLTNGEPATLSPEAINGLLRGELGFDGLVMTDAFNMEAISATTSNADAAKLSLAAGVDLVMLGGLNAVEGTVEQVREAVLSGDIDETSITESFLRVLDTRELQMCAFPEDLRPQIGCEDPNVGCTAGS